MQRHITVVFIVFIKSSAKIAIAMGRARNNMRMRNVKVAHNLIYCYTKSTVVQLEGHFFSLNVLKWKVVDESMEHSPG